MFIDFFQAQNLQNGHFAAAKMCTLEGEDDLSDFMIEIDILSECKHPNVVDLHEAFFHDGKLWVGIIVIIVTVLFNLLYNRCCIRK